MSTNTTGGVIEEIDLESITRSGLRISSGNRERALAVIRSLRFGDVKEQTESFERLKRALDEDRPEGRKLFPEQ